MTTRAIDPKKAFYTDNYDTKRKRRFSVQQLFIIHMLLYASSYTAFSIIIGNHGFTTWSVGESDALEESLTISKAVPLASDLRRSNSQSSQAKNPRTEPLPLEDDKIGFHYAPCDACVGTRVKEKKRTCGVLMSRRSGFAPVQNRSQMVELQQSISDIFAACNQTCPPGICAPRYVITADPAIAAPPIVKAISPNLRSIPARHRLPTVQTLPNGTKVEANYSDYKDYLYAMINPSIIPAPPDLRNYVDNAAYLVSFRVTSEAPYLSKWGWVWLNFPTKNMLGIAAMDASFQILADVVLDINAYLPRGDVQDMRFFEIDGAVYVSYTSCLLPILFKGPSKVSSIPMLSEQSKEFSVHPLASGCPRIKDVSRDGKNYHFFRDTNGSLFIEVFPTGPRQTRLLTTRAADRSLGGKWSLFESHEEIITNEKVPVSFENPFSQDWYRGRGSACCSRLPKEYYKPLLPDGHPANAHDYLLFGIMHLKSKHTKRARSRPDFVYVSQLYAFAPVSPFPAVAYSGLFCFESTDELSEDPYATGTKKHNDLTLGGRSYPCPRIQFVSGMTDLVDDDSKVVVGYGVNDLFSRFVVVEKQYIADRLFRPFSTGLNDWRDRIQRESQSR